MDGMRNYELRYWYDLFNKKYFGKKLPRIPVRFRKCITKHAMAESDFRIPSNEPVEIRIDPYLNKHSKSVIVCLLHEMCHVSTAVKYKRRCGHGPKFQQEIERLYRAGAYTRYNGGLL